MQFNELFSRSLCCIFSRSRKVYYRFLVTTQVPLSRYLRRRSQKGEVCGDTPRPGRGTAVPLRGRYVGIRGAVACPCPCGEVDRLPGLGQATAPTEKPPVFFQIPTLESLHPLLSSYSRLVDAYHLLHASRTGRHAWKRGIRRK